MQIVVVRILKWLECGLAWRSEESTLGRSSVFYMKLQAGVDLIPAIPIMPRNVPDKQREDTFLYCNLLLEYEPS